MGLMDILSQYAGSPAPQANTAGHFDEVAHQAPAGSLGTALASMFRSDATPPFGQTVGQLFGQSNPEQRAGVLNQIIQSLGPGALAAGGGILAKVLGTAGGATSAPPTVSPDQASRVSPDDVTTIATHAEQQNPSIVDRLGSFYSQHPEVVKTLGVAALAVAMGHMQANRA
jgi:hypothetical protein